MLAAVVIEKPQADSFDDLLFLALIHIAYFPRRTVVNNLFPEIDDVFHD
jgi:hypothetical protein